ncbi:MAG: hypothetical protein DMG05_13290, partial [Acidobacteria bacterium]
MPETPSIENDPVVTKSLSLLLLISAIALVFSLVWAIYDEVYGLRPWKDYQARFVKQYTRFLRKTRPLQGVAEKAVRQSEEYQKLDQTLRDAEKAMEHRNKEIGEELRNIDTRLMALTDT